MKPVLLGALLALTLTSCGSDPMLNTAKVENGIKQQYEKEQGIAVQVKCPSDVKLEAGRTFHCLVTQPSSGDKARMTVTIENDNGYVTWVTG